MPEDVYFQKIRSPISAPINPSYLYNHPIIAILVADQEFSYWRAIRMLVWPQWKMEGNSEIILKYWLGRWPGLRPCVCDTYYRSKSYAKGMGSVSLSWWYINGDFSGGWLCENEAISLSQNMKKDTWMKEMRGTVFNAENFRGYVSSVTLLRSYTPGVQEWRLCMQNQTEVKTTYLLYRFLYGYNVIRDSIQLLRFRVMAVLWAVSETVWNSLQTR